MVAVNWNLNDYEAATGGIEAVPTGWYDVIITNTKLENIKSGNGQRLDIYFKIISGEHNGQMAFASCNWLNSSEQATQIGRGQIKSLVLAAGIDPNQFMDTAMLHDRPLKVRLRYEEPSDPKYSGSNAVGGAKPIQGQQQPAYNAQSQAPAQQQPQPQAPAAPQYQQQPQQPIATPHYDPASQPVFHNNGAPQPPFVATSGQTPAPQQQQYQQPPAQAPAPEAPPAMPPFLEGQQNQQAPAQQPPANPAPAQGQAVPQQAQQVAQPAGQPGQNGGAPQLPWTHPQQ